MAVKHYLQIALYAHKEKTSVESLLSHVFKVDTSKFAEDYRRYKQCAQELCKRLTVLSVDILAPGSNILESAFRQLQNIVHQHELCEEHFASSVEVQEEWMSKLKELEDANETLNEEIKLMNEFVKESGADIDRCRHLSSELDYLKRFNEHLVKKRDVVTARGIEASTLVMNGRDAFYQGLGKFDSLLSAVQTVFRVEDDSLPADVTNALVNPPQLDLVNVVCQGEGNAFPEAYNDYLLNLSRATKATIEQSEIYRSTIIDQEAQIRVLLNRLNIESSVLGRRDELLQNLKDEIQRKNEVIPGEHESDKAVHRRLNKI